MPRFAKSRSVVAQIFLVLVLGVRGVALALGGVHLGVGLNLIDLVADSLLGVVCPLADLLASGLCGVLGVIECTHDESLLSVVSDTNRAELTLTRLPWGVQQPPTARQEIDARIVTNVGLCRHTRLTSVGPMKR